MNQKDLKAIQKKLESERERIIKGITSLEKDALNTSQRDSSGDLSGYSFHMADVATDNFDREFNLDLASNEQQLLNDISVALRKIKEGDFGVCEVCDAKINIARLKVVPQAKMCIKCKQEEEDQKKKGFR